jgi:putative FmdB family regulatory protein
MPLYEYQCTCGYQFEARQPLELRANAQCPKCEKLANKKLSTINASYGWRLTEASHIPGNPDRYEKDI